MINEKHYNLESLVQSICCTKMLPENVAVGTAVSRFPAKFSSTKFVNPRKAVGSIWPILQFDK